MDEDVTVAVTAICLECGLVLEGTGLTSGNVAVAEHVEEKHSGRGRRTYLSPAAMVIPDEIPDSASLQMMCGFPPQVLTVRLGVIRNETATLRSDVVKSVLAAEGRLN